MRKRLISRRHLLRGLGNVAIALPVLEAMGEVTGWKALGAREAYGQAAFPNWPRFEWTAPPRES